MSSSKTVKSSPSREEKARYVEEQVDQMKGNIAARVEQLASALERGQSQELLAYLAFSAKFYRYSFANQILIWIQRPQAGLVAGYHKWLELGRQVKHGEKAIRILAPRLVNDPELPYRDGKPQKRCVGFSYVSVFSEDQTEGEALPGSDFMTVQGGDERLFTELERVSRAFHVKTEWKDCEGAHGMTNGTTIWLDPQRCREQPAHAMRVWLHEAAHTVLHFQDNGKRPEDLPDRDTRELEADASAYVLGTFWGIEQADRCADYILCWKGNPEKLRASLERIQRAVTTILGEIDPSKAIALQDEQAA